MGKELYGGSRWAGRPEGTAALTAQAGSLKARSGVDHICCLTLLCKCRGVPPPPDSEQGLCLPSDWGITEAWPILALTSSLREVVTRERQ